MVVVVVVVVVVVCMETVVLVGRVRSLSVNTAVLVPRAVRKPEYYSRGDTGASTYIT